MSSIRADTSNFEKIGKDIFYSKSYINSKKDIFYNYYFGVSNKDVKIETVEKRKYICIKIDKNQTLDKNLNNINSIYKLLIEYIYIKDDVLIKYQNIVNL